MLKRPTMPRLPRSSPYPLARHAWKGGLEELAVNRVAEEGEYDRTPLFDRSAA
jgi:hypothetical protein